MTILRAAINRRLNHGEKCTRECLDTTSLLHIILNSKIQLLVNEKTKSLQKMIKDLKLCPKLMKKIKQVKPAVT